MKLIGIISDTHGYLDEAVIKHFKNCDEIWHAGDIGDITVLEVLEKIAPVVAVYGNIDGGETRKATPEFEIIKYGKQVVLIIHIADRLPKYNRRVRELIDQYHPTVLICGHSHILKVQYDKDNELLYINPGAAGKHGFHRVKTIMTVELTKEKPQNLRVIELGRRGKSA